MDEGYIFIFGVLVVLLFAIGIFITIKEFQNLDAKKQENYAKDISKMEVKKK